jgi:hypothetical protein
MHQTLKHQKPSSTELFRLDGHRGRTASFSALYQMNRKKEKKQTQMGKKKPQGSSA